MFKFYVFKAITQSEKGIKKKGLSSLTTTKVGVKIDQVLIRLQSFEKLKSPQI